MAAGRVELLATQFAQFSKLACGLEALVGGGSRVGVLRGVGGDGRDGVAQGGRLGQVAAHAGGGQGLGNESLALGGTLGGHGFHAAVQRVDAALDGVDQAGERRDGLTRHRGGRAQSVLFGCDRALQRVKRGVGGRARGVSLLLQGGGGVFGGRQDGCDRPAE